MDDNRIEIVASLDIPKTKSTIKSELENDIKPDLDSAKALQIICHIDESSVSALRKELEQISKSLTLSVPTTTIKIDGKSSSSAQSIMSAITEGANEANKAIKKVNKSIADLDPTLLEKLQGFEPIFFNEPDSDRDGYINILATKNALEELLKPLGEVSVVAKSIAGDTPDGLHRLEASIISDTNELKKLNLELRNGEELFDLVSSTYSDSGVTKSIKQAQKEAEKLTKQFIEIETRFLNPTNSKPIENADNLKRLSDQAVIVAESIQKLENADAGAFDSLKREADMAISNYKALANEIRGAETAAQKLRAQKVEVIVAKEVEKLSQFKNNVANSFLSGQELNELNSKITSLEESLSKVGSDKKALIEYQDELSKVQEHFNTLNKAARNQAGIDSYSNRIQKVSAALEDWGNKNKKAINSNKQMAGSLATYSEKWQELNKRMSDLITKMHSNEGLNKQDIEQFKRLNEEIATFKKEADAANLTTSAFFRNMRMQLSQVLMQWISLQGAIRIIKSMVSEVRDLDNAMINLKKVTDETDETYRRFTNSAQKQAAELHTTTTAVVEQTAEWAKLGFSIDEAQKLSRISAIYAKVGEVDNATAVSDLVTVLKAFNQTADESIRTVDALNKLGNTFATDAKSLGEGISVSASALAMAGNDLYQSLAMLTGGTEITQNARETGNAIKVISLRIRGMKGALEELNEETEGIESISKIQTQILNLTQNKVNIFNDDGTFKSTYEILKQISEIYYDLSDTSRASLTEILFGKVRANQGLAIIQAFQSGQIEKAYETAVDSANSAQEEFDKMSEGIEAHIQDLKQAFETLSNTIINSDLIKFVVDSGTTILKILNEITEKFGTLPTLLTGLAAFGGFKGVGKLKPNMPIYAPLQLCA